MTHPWNEGEPVEGHCSAPPLVPVLAMMIIDCMFTEEN